MDQRESRQRRIALSGIILAVTVCFLGCGKNTTDHSTITHAVDEHEATANAAVGAAFRSSESTEVIGELRRLLREGDDRTRVGALRALKMCGDNALPAAPELVALLANPYASLSPEAQSLLMSFGVRAPDVTPELIQIAEDGPEWARYRAIMVLRFQDDAANRATAGESASLGPTWATTSRTSAFHRPSSRSMPTRSASNAASSDSACWRA